MFRSAYENEEMYPKESKENDLFESNINKSLQRYTDDLIPVVISPLQCFFCMDFYFQMWYN